MLCKITQNIKKKLFMTSAGWAAKHRFNAWYVRKVISKLTSDSSYASQATGTARKIVRQLRRDKVLV